MDLRIWKLRSHQLTTLPAKRRSESTFTHVEAALSHERADDVVVVVGDGGFVLVEMACHTLVAYSTY